jgi:hypothetical protein
MDPVPHGRTRHSDVRCRASSRSGLLLEGERYERTFEEAGIYPLACSIHPGVTGAIVVGGGVQDVRTALVAVTLIGGAGVGVLAMAQLRGRRNSDG